jgi:leucyl-tRNA synthetase
MAVPGHDQRDWDFAKKYGLEILEVVSGGDVTKEAYVDDGKLVNSRFLDGLSVLEAKEKMTSWLEEKGIGKRTVNYKLRDWLFSRQRYWGEPFPIIHTSDGPKLLPEDSLPVLLPEVERYQPTEDGEPPLARAENWVNTTDPETGLPAKRETNTMPQWAGSCWYYLRYLDAKNDKAAWSKESENYWMPVDLYVGGVEHAVLHLLYSRFWHHVLYDLGLVSTREPFKRLVNQGMILGEDGQKMSKSRGNVINPDDMIKEYGADTLRMYEMFMGPLEQVKPWSTQSAAGVYKFLNRVWNLVIDQDGAIKQSIVADDTDDLDTLAIEKALHRTIKKVTEDLDAMKFHTAIAQLMTFSNEAAAAPRIPRRVIKAFILLLAPFVPHIAEELWQRLGGEITLAYQPWPGFDAGLAKLDTVTIAVQVNGKLRDTLEAAPECTEGELLSQAKALPKVQGYLLGKTMVREIVVPKRLVNFVVK